MKVKGKARRSIWLNADGWSVSVIDQRLLPHHFETAQLTASQEAADAIAQMWVRGAPLIGVTAAYGVCLAMREDSSDASLEQACRSLAETRPTAVNLHWALEQMRACLVEIAPAQRVQAAYARASAIVEDDVECCSRIGDHGLELLAALRRDKDRRLGILTHCNAGWLATVDWGTALAPIYKAHEAGIEMMVYVDETRPRNQGASLTAWELEQHGVPHTLIVDNAGGHLMQHGLIDVCLVGSDRTTARGDVCNKIGTYLKALAAKDNDVPFYAALPHSTIDWNLQDGVAEIPIEERSGREVSHIRGLDRDGHWREVGIAPTNSPVLNVGFDVTPARLITGIISERGVCAASPEGLAGLYPKTSAHDS